MQYRVELWDASGRRMSVFGQVPLLEAIRSAPDGRDTVRGLLPEGVERLGIGDRVAVFLDDTLVCAAPITSTAPQWSDTRKLILDRYARATRTWSASTPRGRSARW